MVRQKSPKPPGQRASPPRKRDTAVTKGAFLQAGERLFARKGFDGVTLDQLAEEAGANKALIAYHFGSKENLYDAVIAAIVKEVVSAVMADLGQGKEPIENFRHYVRVLAREFAARPTFPAIILREYAHGPEQKRVEAFEPITDLFRMTETLYLAGRQDGVFRELDPHQLHLSIVGPLIYFVATIPFRALMSDRFPPDISRPTVQSFAEHHERLILDGLLARQK